MDPTHSSMLAISARAFTKSSIRTQSRLMATVGDNVPSGVTVDVVGPDGEFREVDLGALLSAHKKAIIFAVPGAFTPTCSAKHLPGFVEKAAALKAKGAEEVYCLSVNDKFVMRSWGAATEGAMAAGITFVADGNGEYARALGLAVDLSGNRMGSRCNRFAAVVEHGKFTLLNVDAKGFETTDADTILAAL